MIGLTKLVLKRPVSVIILLFGLAVFGFMSITGLPMELTPDIQMPMLIIVTNWNGTAAEDVEKLVTRPIENSAGTMNGVTDIISQTMESTSLVQLVYDYGTDMDKAYNDLRSSLDGLSQILPKDAQRPTVIEMNMNAGSSMSLSVTSDSVGDLRYYVDENIVPEFEKLATVSDISVSGGIQNYIKIEIDEKMMRQYGVSMQTLANCISTANFSIPSGSVDLGSQSMSVRNSVEMNSLEMIGNIAVPLQSGDIIHLSDVANVYLQDKSTNSISRFNGYGNISVGLTKRQSVTDVEMSEDVLKVIDNLNSQNSGVKIEVISNNADNISSSIASVRDSLLAGVAISMVILFLFFGDFKASLITASSMPISLLLTFILMDMIGFTLNIITLGGMVLGVGMMVDNSIVVLDSCFKSKTHNNTMLDAATEGTRFVLMSILGGTITTVVVFFPIAVTQGLSGQLFMPLGFTIIFSLVASLLSAITLVPLCFYKYKPTEKRNAPVAFLLKKVELAYGRLLKKILDKKIIVSFIMLLMLVASVICATKLNAELMPSSDNGTVDVSIEFRPGLKIERVNEIVTQIESIVAEQPDVDRYSVSAGGSGLSASTGTTAGVSAYLKDERVMTTTEFADMLREKTANITDCSISISGTSSNGLTSETVDVYLSSSDMVALEEFSHEVEALMNSNENIIRVSSSLSGGNPQLEVVVDPIQAASFGMTPIQVSQTISTALNGMSTVSVTMDDQRYDIRIEYPEEEYQTVEDLKDYIVVTPAGLSVPLDEIAEFKFTTSPLAIMRENNQYVISITGTPRTGTRFEVNAQIMQQVNEMKFPDGVGLYESMATAMMNDEFFSIGKAILIAIILVFMVMGIQFESIKYSAMVMLTMPFSLIGAFPLLLLFNATISMTSLLGFLILVGTVVNNGILFVDTANQYRETMDIKTALVNTGRTRLRPILMTTLTTILSMIPMGLGIGDGAELMQGMALVVIGGLTAATLLTLLFLPTFYLIMDGTGKKKKKKGKNKDGGSSDEPVEVQSEPTTETSPATV